ncbi:SRPBCC domain-containing protein [Brevibacillus humidisoli]|uniref:SRPBCC family protein n=1 Tax=Brevibacillus humidisoli TaxID=2895522 RepID=UPI001E3ABE74|nr:SRPBCC domain-containing protein [Brevibacillus humidisoli]UFJ41680.1 SRPBCC domain-containing protein [Brevibacillus humidisoli]
MPQIVKEVTIAASPELVWWAWTSSDRVAAWFAPEANVEARVGGAFELFFDPANREQMSTKGCIYTELKPKERLAFTWKGPDPFAELMNRQAELTRVVVTLQEENGGTRLLLEHAGWGDGDEWAKALEWHQMAWDQVLGSLKSALESGEGQLCCQPE